MKTPHSGVSIVIVLAGIAGCISFTDEHWLEARGRGWAEETAPNGEAYARYIASIVYERQGQREQAVRELRQVTALAPKALTPKLRLIRSYLREKEYAEALTVCEKALQENPAYPNLWIIAGEVYRRLDRYDDAMEAFTKAIELNPDNLLGYGALVDIQESINDLVATVDVYERLIELSPKSARLHYQLGLTLARINDSEGARKALTRALELNPGFIRPRYLLGVIALEAGDNEEALKYLTSYVKSRPEDIAAAENLAGALARLGRYPDAMKLLSALMAGSHAQPKHHLDAMYVMMLAGQPKEAEKLAPPEGRPIFTALMTGFARQASGASWPETFEAFDSIEGDLDTECNETLNDLLYLFGSEAMGAWLLERLEACREEVASRNLALIQARTLMSLDRHAEAVDVLTPLFDAFAPDLWLHYYLAICHEELDHFEETEEHLKACIEYNPDDPDMLNFLGYLYAEEGVHLEEAEDLLKRALKLKPDSPFYLDSLGWVYYKQGKADEAVDLIQRAIYGMETDDAILRDHLGDAYLLKGEVKQAVEEWERALRLDPKIEGVQEKLEKHRPAAVKDEGERMKDEG